MRKKFYNSLSVSWIDFSIVWIEYKFVWVICAIMSFEKTKLKQSSGDSFSGSGFFLMETKFSRALGRKSLYGGKQPFSIYMPKKTFSLPSLLEARELVFRTYFFLLHVSQTLLVLVFRKVGMVLKKAMEYHHN